MSADDDQPTCPRPDPNGPQPGDEHIAERLRQLQAEADAAPIELPQLPGLKFLGLLGRGGMSTVWLAVQQSLGRKVAVKILAQGLTGQSKARDRMVREAQALGRLQHPHIVDIHDVVADGECIALLMEWVDGPTAQQLARGLPRPPEPVAMAQVAALIGATEAQVSARGSDWQRFAVALMRDVAGAVHAAHDVGLLHLDIKPSNILLHRDGMAKLADFGVAREMNLALTHTGTFAGTPIYAAPEQLARRDHQIGAPTDVYGLGITLYELLARVQPIDARSLTEVLQCIERGGVPPLSDRVEVSADLEAVVHRAIEPDPARRYATAAAFAEDLQAVLDRTPVHAPTLTRFVRLRRWARYEPWRAALAAALLVLVPVLAVVGGTLLTQYSSIVEAHDRDRLARGRDCLQRACRVVIGVEDFGPEVRREFEQAMELMPDSAMALAGYATLLGNRDPAAAGQLLTAHRTVDRQCTALDLLRTRATDNRQYFSDAEVERLAGSDDPVDLFVGALDRLMLARERVDPKSFRRALPMLTRLAASDAQPDLLVQGLQMVAAAGAGDLQQLELARYAVRTHWPDSTPAVQFLVIAHRDVDPKTAEAACREHLARHPDDLKIVHMLIRVLAYGPAPKSALSEIERLVAAGVPADVLHRDKLVTLAILDRRAELKAELGEQELTASADESGLRGSLLALFDRDGALACFRSALPKADAVDAASLHFRIGNVLLEGRDPATTDEGLREVELAVHLRPERAEYRWRLAIGLAMSSKQAIARTHFDWLRERELWLDHAAIFMVRCYAQLNDYEATLAVAKQWAAKCKEPNGADSYIGIALSRLGRPDEAMEPLCAGLRAKGYAPSFVERAWLMVDPDGSKQLRNVPLARHDLDGLLKNPRMRGKEGPWQLIVLGAVQLAEGDRDGALATLAKAKTLVDKPEDLAPADLRQRIEYAEQRWRR